MAVAVMQSFAAKPGYGMCICKRVNGSVQQDTVLDTPRKVFVLVASNTIGYKIPDRDFIIPEGKVNMS
jgi:hypothetical protein